MMKRFLSSAGFCVWQSPILQQSLNGWSALTVFRMGSPVKPPCQQLVIPDGSLVPRTIRAYVSMNMAARLLSAAKFKLHRAVERFKTLADLIAIRLANLLSLPKKRLIIVDDYFPCLATAFRVAEFNAIFERFDHAVLYASWPDTINFTKYAKCYPQFAGRIFKFHPARRLTGSAAYVVF